MGHLDMRMDQSAGLSAAEWLEQIDENALANVLFQYGEEPRSRRIARAIVAGRPWHRTAELAECIAKASGYKIAGPIQQRDPFRPFVLQ